jgi:hypothetical protein
MTRPTIRIHNLSTNEIIDREMTESEFENFTNSHIEVPSYHAEIAAKSMQAEVTE